MTKGETVTHEVSLSFHPGRWRFDWRCTCGASGVGHMDQELEHLSLEGLPIEAAAQMTKGEQ